ncbi:MAG TPA: hypothetical protein VG777_02045 [Thermoanaerobaculia bacterium]|nr:hypothetical protein [Thermoanaerobaculia bacterium]
MKPFEEAARDAGRALGDLGAGERSALVEEVARALAELAAEPARRRRSRKSEIRSAKSETNPKLE